MRLVNQFRIHLLLSLLDAFDVNLSSSPSKSTRQAVSTFQTIQTWPLALIQWASKYFLRPFHTSPGRSAAIPETWTSLWSHRLRQIRRQTRVTIKGA